MVSKQSTRASINPSSFAIFSVNKGSLNSTRSRFFYANMCNSRWSSAHKKITRTPRVVYLSAILCFTKQDPFLASSPKTNVAHSHTQGTSRSTIHLKMHFIAPILLATASNIEPPTKLCNAKNAYLCNAKIFLCSSWN